MSIVLFAVFPYVAVVAAVAGGIWRYAGNRFSYSSLSTQLLENRRLFWGSIAWHYGITIILLAHLLAWLVPGSTAAILGGGVRLFLIEAVGLALALFTLFGLVVLIARRLDRTSRARPTTSPMDWILLIVLLAQVVSGMLIALFQRWGAVWYLSTATPWLWSLVTLQPDASIVAALPLLVQMHFVGGFLLVLLFPMTRLVHLAVPPVTYLWRPYQVVIWRQPPRRRQLAPGALMAGSPGGADLLPNGAPPPPPADLARPRPAGADPPVTRRSFLSRVSLAAGAVGALIVAIPSVSFLLGLRGIPRVWAAVGRLSEFPIGETHKVVFADPSPLPWSGVTAVTAAWLRRDAADSFIAFSINCTHLGCPVRWIASAELFMCPCHGGVFYRDGRVASGPPPEPLATYPVRVRDGNVEILTSPLPISGR